MLYSEQYIARLIFRHFRGELSAAENQELEAWIAASSRNREFFRSLERENTLFDILEQNERDKETDVSKLIFEKIQVLIQESDTPVIPLSSPYRRPSYRIRWGYYAAAIVLLIATVGVFWFSRSSEVHRMDKPIAAKVIDDVAPGSNKAVLTLSDGRTVALDDDGGKTIDENGTLITNNKGELLYENSDVSVMNKMTTGKGGQYKIVLSDGTQAWLNSASSLTYPTFFNASKREVMVTGEVYFEVAENKKKPFVVNMPGGGAIQVLGTHFNVNVYEDEAEQVTTLVEGSIKLTNKTEDVIVSPGHQAVLFNDNTKGKQMLQVQKANIEQALAWRSNFFIFNKADLPVVMRQLGRWYDLDIEYKGKVPERSLQGKIPRDIPLSQVLSAFAKMDLNFEVKGKRLIVHSDN